KGTVELLFKHLGIKDIVFRAADTLKGMHPGRTASIMINDVEIGYIGQVHPGLQKKYDIDESYVFQLDLEKMYTFQANMDQYKPLPKYPANTRDMSILVDEQVPASDLKQLIRQKGGSILESVELFDVYTGDKMRDGHKSLAFALIYRKLEG